MSPKERLEKLSPELRDTALLRWMEWLDFCVEYPERGAEELKQMIKRQAELNAAS